MHRWCRRLLLLSLAVCLGACADLPEDDVSLGGTQQPIIYGADDRREVYEHPSGQLRALASSAVVALVPRSRFLQTKAGEFAIFTRPLEQAFDVCADERFATQPTAADCSGVLIDDDLVLTAGHCFASDQACADSAVVFDYFYASPDVLEPIGWGDVHGCRRIVHRSFSPAASGKRIDYAVVQLDRRPAGRTPVPMRTTPLLTGEPLATVGSASGLPAKIDSGSRLLNPRALELDYFLLDSDTFAGSSGSGVFDAEAKLVGVLVRGGADYERRPGEACNVPKVVRLPSDIAAVRVSVGEEATYVARAVDGLCASGWPSARLCGKQPSCGDGFCSGAETRVDCPADCGCAGPGCAEPRLAKAATPGPVADKSKTDGCTVSAPGDTRGASAPLTLLSLGLLAAQRRKRRR